jgi:hypothetical protein
MDAKNTCDSRRNDRSHMDYQGADGVQDAFSIVRVHDPISEFFSPPFLTHHKARISPVIETQKAFTLPFVKKNL